MLAAIAAALYARRAAVATEETVEVAKSDQAGAADALATAARNASAAERLAINAEETSRLQLRAYLSVEVVDHPVLSDDLPMRVKFTFTNHGQTPAINFRYEGCFQMAGYPDPDIFELDFRPGGSRHNISQNASITTHIDLPESPLGKDLMNDIIRGEEVRIYLWGIAKYEDIFEREHAVRFQYEMGGSTSINPGRLILSATGNTST